MKQRNESALETVENTMFVSQVVDDIIRNYSAIFEVGCVFSLLSVVSWLTFPSSPHLSPFPPVHWKRPPIHPLCAGTVSL